MHLRLGISPPSRCKNSDFFWIHVQFSQISSKRPSIFSLFGWNLAKSLQLWRILTNFQREPKGSNNMATPVKIIPTWHGEAARAFIQPERISLSNPPMNRLIPELRSLTRSLWPPQTARFIWLKIVKTSISGW